MDGGGSGSQNPEERDSERMMDDYLKSLELHRKKIAKDGSCLFRAVAEQVLHCQSLHIEVRARCVEFLRNNRNTYEAFIEGDFEDYLLKLQDPQQWVGEVEINALAVMYKRDFLIFQEPGKPAVNITSNNFTDTVMLCFLNGNHYDSVYPISRLKNAALCQSIVYELLYEGVFKVEHSVLAQCQRAGKNDVFSDDNLPLCGSSDESDDDLGEPLWVENEVPAAPKHKGRGQRGTQLPERVRRSLKTTLFRNIDYDIWHKTKRAQQKMDYYFAAGMQFSVGDRCKVCLEGSGQSYTATVKQLASDNGMVTVYSEDLGQKEVPVWSLRPSTNDNKSWTAVVSREKRISNGHGGLEDRGRGRGRGKHILASTLVSQATALGSNGRVLKQQSWPPHPAEDEQAGGKPRRSVSTVDSSFGLTEKQRSAKVEEEKSIALVEIQRRDEHSFPALGTPTLVDGGRKKAVDKKRAQRTKTKSPVEDVQAFAPSDGKPPRPASPAPPPGLAPPPTTSTASTPLVADKPSTAPPAKIHSRDAQQNRAPSPAWVATAPPIRPSFALAAVRPPSPPAAATAASAKPSAPATGGAVPPSAPSSASPISFLTPVLPVASSPPTSSALSSSSPPTSSSSISARQAKSRSSPTFIAPIAPISAHGFLPPNSTQSRCVVTHPHPSSPTVPLPSPALSFSSSSSSLHQPAWVHRDPLVSTQTPNFELTPDASQTPQSQSKTTFVASQPPSQTQAPVPSKDPEPAATPDGSAESQMQPETKTIPPQSHPLYPRHQPLPRSEDASLTYQPQPHSDPPPDAASFHHTHTAQSTVLPPTNTPPSPHVAPQQSNQPTQQPPSVPTHPPLSLFPYLPSIPGVVPLQQVSQLYQDPLYPGFPQGEKGSVAPIPPFSSCKLGEDLPQDKNVLRFFFNLGVKAYSNPMYPPYIYLLPLQQTHTMNPQGPSLSPSPTPSPQYPSSSHHVQPQEPYNPPQYPPPSLPAHYDPAPAAPSHSDAFHPPRYQVMETPPQQQQQQPLLPCPSLSWQQQQQQQQQMMAPAVSYPSSTPHYPVPQQIPQGYHPSQGPGLPLYPSGVPSYPHTTLAYQPQEPHVSLEVLENNQHPCGPTDLVPSSMAAGLICTSSRAVVLPAFAVKKEAVLLVDPTHNTKPMHVSNSVIKDVPVAMTTVRSSGSTPGSPLHHDLLSKTGTDNGAPRGYQGQQQLLHSPNTFASSGGPEHRLVGYPPTAVPPMSIGCNTNNDWGEEAQGKHTRMNHQGARRNYRGGGRWRGGYDSDRRSNRKRCDGDAGPPQSYSHYNPSQRGRGRGF